jgi:hypothetical protein
MKRASLTRVSHIYNCSENSVWLDLQILYFRLKFIYKSYRQVLTPVNNSQLLLKLEILGKLRLFTFHKNTIQRKHNILTGSFSFRRNVSSHDLEPQSIAVTKLAALSVPTFSFSTQPKHWHFLLPLCDTILLSQNVFL